MTAALPLVTARLRIDPLRADDAPTLRRLVTLPEVGRMLFIFPPDYTLAAATELIAAQHDPASRPLRLAIRLRDAPGLIGTIGLGAGEAPDIYYFLDPAQAGQGLMREALAAFLPFARTRYGLTTLGAKVFTDNPASAHLLEAVGFTRTDLAQVQSAARPAPAPVWLYRRET